MVVVDTSVWVDYLRGVGSPQTDALDDLLEDGQPVAMTDMVYAELMRGAADDEHARTLDEALAGFQVLFLEGLDDLERAAKLYRDSRSIGQQVRNTIDCLIAAVCIRVNAEILHCDADYDRLGRVSDLRTYPCAV